MGTSFEESLQFFTILHHFHIYHCKIVPDKFCREIYVLKYFN